ncbi:MAG: hypothetical protein E6Q98_15605 [Rhodospirillaceae bacterium]|nr:MAG: hypothetical protein E6Q98_15605 [Rhodospirillaceae bacterium]
MTDTICQTETVGQVGGICPTDAACEPAGQLAGHRWYRQRRRIFLLLGIVLAGSPVFLQFLYGPLVALAIGSVDRILVDKSARTLSLMHDGKAVYTASISLGKNPVGQKQREGDGRTPEGTYRLSWRDPSSDYHRAILISYPTMAQASRAEAAGLAPGGEIMVHGQKYPWRWFSRSPLTNGCVGLSNTAMDVVWYATAGGMPITIRP